jgi:phenylalanyl-tRNA synthetase alpha chain
MAAAAPITTIAPEELESVVLQAVNNNDENTADTWKFAQALNIEHVKILGVVNSLIADGLLVSSPLSVNYLELTADAHDALASGAPEIQVYRLVPAAGCPNAELQLAGKAMNPSSFKAGFGACMKNKWLKNDKASGLVVRLVEDEPADELAVVLSKVIAGNGAMDCIPAKEIKNLKRRQMLQAQTRKSVSLAKGPAFALQRVKAAADLTKEMLESGSWQTEKFKEYNFNSLGTPPAGGFLHPLLKVRMEFRKILLEMGFEEMPANRFVESSFWNFDALFQPQQHPARDAHDTFFLSKPEFTNTVPEDYLQRVKATHENGGATGSLGYKYNWKREESMKNILRTHTTAISSQMLYAMGQDPDGFKPRKFFSIDRVFRNETMDATHLAEFHQVEGVVADRNLSLGDLIGTIKSFFEKIGITEVRFKPAYNPYTEPSMEIFAFHPDLNCWTEVGNSGMFRPEMLLPMGLPPDVNVIAWGLSLERPTMIKYRIDNIRDLFGHKIDLNTTRKAPISRYF